MSLSPSSPPSLDTFPINIASERAFRHLTSTAFGTIIALRPQTEQLFDNQPMTFCYPVVLFSTGHGETIEVLSTQGCVPGSLRVGDTVTVYYDTACPALVSIEKNALF